MNSYEEKLNFLMHEYCTAVGYQRKKIFNQVCVILLGDNPASGKVRSIIHNYIQAYNTLLEVEDVLHDCIMEFIPLYAKKQYDNSDIPFFQWFLTCVKNWCKDKIYKKNVRIVVHEDGSKEQIRRFTSLDQKREDSHFDIEDTAPDLAQQYETKNTIESLLAHMISTIRFMEHHGGKKNNPVRLLYSKCFATESILNFCKDELYREFSLNQQDAFKAIHPDFLDFFMTAECRTFQEIDITAMKTYVQLDISDKDNEIKRPLEAKVYQKYLPAVLGRSVTSAAISQQKKHFCELLGFDPDKGTWTED